MAKIKVAGQPSVAKKVWMKQKDLLHKCRTLQASGFGQGTDPYEAALAAMKQHSRTHSLLLGQMTAIEQEYTAEHP